MRAAGIAAAAGHAGAGVRGRHCEAGEYRRFLDGQAISPAYRRQKLRFRDAFVERWPALDEWFAEPLAVRVGRLPGEPSRGGVCDPVSQRGRSYLLYLGLRGHATFDYEWLLAVGQLCAGELATQLGLDLGVARLVDEATRLGFNRAAAAQATGWAVARIALHTGDPDPEHITLAHLEELRAAVRRLGERADLARFYGSRERYRNSPAKDWITHLHQLHVVLFHRGQIAEQPRKHMPRYAIQPPVPTRMRAVVERWLAARRLTDRPATVARFELVLRCFTAWIAQTHPTVQSFAAVTREQSLEFLQALADEPNQRTGRPLAVQTRIGHTSALASFFRDTAAWEWDDVPGRPLLGPGDAPPRPARVPRFIPAAELERLMTAIDQLACPYQRAALLTARWSGARQGEIRRLAVDCLDRYPDGTARLRLPAGKTHRERSVPLHDEAAEALRAAAARRAGAASGRSSTSSPARPPATCSRSTASCSPAPTSSSSRCAAPARPPA